MIQDRLIELRELVRRLQADIDQSEAEKLSLRSEISSLKIELKSAHKNMVQRQKLHDDCKTCLYRIEAQKRLGLNDERV